MEGVEEKEVKILAHILAMADDEVLGLIQPRVIRDIKREDPTPMFKAFIVGQEGESRPKIVGVGATIQRWYQSAIEKLTEKLGLGLPVYHNHTPTNRDKNRSAIGEVVGKALKSIEGALSSVVVAYIYPQFKDLPLDVASIEAGLMVPQDSREFDVRDVDIQEVTGIALGNSQTNKPAFPKATLIAQLQAMSEKSHQGDQTMTLDEIQKAIQEGKFKPSDVFAPTALTSDPFIKEHVEEKINNAKGYDIRKRQDLEEKLATLEKDKKDAQDKLSALEKTQAKATARETFAAILKERPKLAGDPRLIKFVQKGYEKLFSPKEGADLKAELNKFIDDQVTEFADLMGDAKGGGKEKTDAEKAAEAEQQAAEDKRDKKNLLDPKNNELIPTEP